METTINILGILSIGFAVCNFGMCRIISVAEVSAAILDATGNDFDGDWSDEYATDCDD